MYQPHKYRKICFQLIESMMEQFILEQLEYRHKEDATDASDLVYIYIGFANLLEDAAIALRTETLKDFGIIENSRYIESYEKLKKIEAEFN